MNKGLYKQIKKFILSHKDPKSRLGLNYKNYKDYGTFIRTIARENNIKISDDLCPRYKLLKKEFKNNKIDYYSCLKYKDECCNENNYKCYEKLTKIYLFYNYWFWLNIINADTFLKILEENNE